MSFIESILEEALESGCISCHKCGSLIESDAIECRCGWKNPLIELGMI